MKENWFNFENEIPLYALNEAYFGETPGIKKAQEALDKLRDKYASTTYRYKPEAIQSKEHQAFNKAIEDCFGFDIFDLTICQTGMRFGACTMPIGTEWDCVNVKDNIIITSDGYAYKKSAKFCAWVAIDAGMLFNKEKYTNREIMAVILHEIGHNFSDKNGLINRLRILGSVTTLISGIILTFVNPVIGLTLLAFSSSTFHKNLILLEQYMNKKYPTFMRYKYTLDNLIGKGLSLLEEIKFIANLTNMINIPGKVLGYFIGRSMRIGKMLMANPGRLVSLFSAYPDEQFADNFASLYGYGADLNSSLEKIYEGSGSPRVTENWLAHNAPFILNAYDLMTLPISVVCAPLDEHPMIFERCQNTLRNLKYQAEETKNPKLKARINADIAKCEKQMKDYYDAGNAAQDKSTTAFFNRAYGAFCLGFFGGDFRHHIADAIFNVKGSFSEKADKNKK